MNQETELQLVPRQKIEHSGRWFEFDGFRNFPDLIAREFSIERGSWELSRTEGEGHGVEIHKEGKAELYYGNAEEEKNCLATLVQLIRQKKGFLPEVSVKEHFTFKIRGYHIDIARGGVPKLETFESLIRWLFLLKYNVLEIYFEDLYPWKSFGNLGVERGRITEGELTQIISYAENFGIEVIPSLELLGHMENFLTLPEYSEFKELWWVKNDGCIDPSNEHARQFTQRLLRDVLECPEWKHLNLGGDETWSLGRGRSLDKTNTFQAPELYLKHISSLLDIVKKSGKTAIIWGDMKIGMTLPESERTKWEKISSSSIWDQVLIANWDYDAEDEQHFDKRIKQIGHFHRQLACPSVSNFNRLYPNYDTAIRNMRNFLSAARTNGLVGFLITSWGDDGAECLFSFLDPLILAAMEIAEGDGLWEKKWVRLAHEDENLLELRKELGTTSIADRVKEIVFCSDHSGWPSDSPDLLRLWKRTLSNPKPENLPPDIKFISDCLKVGIRVIEKDAKAEDFIRLASDYRALWLNERKMEGLARVFARFWASAGLMCLGYTT